MSGPSLCTLVLIAVVSCYALSSTKALQHEQQPQQAKQKLDLPNRINGMERSGQSLHMESRRKRDYKELNDIIDELGEGGANSGSGITYARKATAAAATEAAQPQDYDLDNMPALTYYLLLQKLRQLQSVEPTYRVRTPRLGRSIDFQRLFDSTGGNGNGNGNIDGHPSSRNEHEQQAVSFAGGNSDENEESFGLGLGPGASRQFVARLMKKSVPFKPRLGKRAQVCGNSGGGD